MWYESVVDGTDGHVESAVPRRMTALVGTGRPSRLPGAVYLIQKVQCRHKLVVESLEGRVRRGV